MLENNYKYVLLVFRDHGYTFGLSEQVKHLKWIQYTFMWNTEKWKCCFDVNVWHFAWNDLNFGHTNYDFSLISLNSLMFFPTCILSPLSQMKQSQKEKSLFGHCHTKAETCDKGLHCLVLNGPQSKKVGNHWFIVERLLFNILWSGCTHMHMCTHTHTLSGDQIVTHLTPD